MEKKQAFHGSDLEKIEKIYGIKKEDIIPFGGNVNPLGISPLLKQSMAEHLDSVCEYPDRDYKELRDSLSYYLGIPAANIIPGNGATELIGLTFQVLCPKMLCCWLPPTQNIHGKFLWQAVPTKNTF